MPREKPFHSAFRVDSSAPARPLVAYGLVRRASRTSEYSAELGTGSVLRNVRFGPVEHDELHPPVLRAIRLGVVGNEGPVRAESLRPEPRGVNPGRYEVAPHRLGAALREPPVVGGLATPVGMPFDPDLPDRWH